MTVDPKLSAAEQIAELLTERAHHVDRIAWLIDEGAKNERRANIAEAEAKGLKEDLDLELRVSGERADELEKLKTITASMDGFKETAELFEIGAVLGVCDDMGRKPNGERPGPKSGAILEEVKYRQDLLRDALNALNRMDAHEGLCDQIRRALFTAAED